ncbi:hypothetical protein ACH5RR_033428 [Cinchona calisaya]|uniref:Uncharacterized protein n=1 Tax=Cinchona calisaya TaxID=153742 RepID=A0ABD2YMZ3_9GENT
MEAVPEELLATLPNNLMGTDNWKIQDVHMWFGGYIKWEPKVRYVGEKKAIFERRRISEITFDKLVAMHNKVNPRSEVSFYFRLPDYQASRLASKEQSGNVEQLAAVEQVSNQLQAITKAKRSKRLTTKAKEKNNEAEVAEKSKNDEAEAKKNNNNEVAGNVKQQVEEEEPEWLKEVLETMEDEDIF